MNVLVLWASGDHHGCTPRKQGMLVDLVELVDLVDVCDISLLSHESTRA